jgi:hypothetical protein
VQDLSIELLASWTADKLVSMIQTLFSPVFALFDRSLNVQPAYSTTLRAQYLPLLPDY